MQSFFLLPAWEILLVIVGPLLTATLLMGRVRKVLQRRRARRRRFNVNRCECGYLMDNLTVVRCPECGRVPGFGVTAEELGLTRQELERAHLAKMRRQALP